MTRNKCSFLDATVDLTGDRVAFQSFVRSGNTFLRTYLEQITSIFTGEDKSVRRSFDFSMIGLLGTDITSNSNRVWITKTHYPMNMPHTSVFDA